MPEDLQMRELALKLANEYEDRMMSTPDTVVQRAQAYLDFLMGQSKDERVEVTM